MLYQQHGERRRPPDCPHQLRPAEPAPADRFAQCFNFKYVRGTAGAVNYYYIHNLVFPWSDKYMKPYPKNGKWKWYKRKKNY